MLRGAVVGLGKMGISHAAILGALPMVELMAACDTSQLVFSAFKRYTQLTVYNDHQKMLDNENLDFIVVAVPTRFHYAIVKDSVEKGIHVFCEKPFTINSSEGEELALLAKKKGIVNQVGYHNHFIGTFRELKRLLDEGVLGDLLHFNGEAYGPVVVKDQFSTWRSKTNEGGGCLYDYASHVINLIQWLLGRPVRATGTIIKSFFSQSVEDAVYSNIYLESGLTGSLLVNWSDETYRKMSTSITIQGRKGKIICDATELKIYLTAPNKDLGLNDGWTVRNITDLTPPCIFYLRGEEYTEQLNHFIDNIKNQNSNGNNTFEEACYTSKFIEMLVVNANQEALNGQDSLRR